MQSTRAHILVALCSALCSLSLTSCDGHQPDAIAGNRTACTAASTQRNRSSNCLVYSPPPLAGRGSEEQNSRTLLPSCFRVMVTNSPVVVSSSATVCWQACKSHPNSHLGLLRSEPVS
jgi:hypothetical protein